jgi:hypothetical protein
VSGKVRSAIPFAMPHHHHDEHCAYDWPHNRSILHHSSRRRRLPTDHASSSRIPPHTRRPPRRLNRPAVEDETVGLGDLVAAARAPTSARMTPFESALFLVAEHAVGCGDSSGHRFQLHPNERLAAGLAHPADNTSDLVLASTASGAALSHSAFALPSTLGRAIRHGTAWASTTSLLESARRARRA